MCCVKTEEKDSNLEILLGKQYWFLIHQCDIIIDLIISICKNQGKKGNYVTADYGGPDRMPSRQDAQRDVKTNCMERLHEYRYGWRYYIYRHALRKCGTGGRALQHEKKTEDTKTLINLNISAPTECRERTS